MIKKPMLAATIDDLSKIKYPVLVTPKLDGIRCIKVNGQALSRKFKPIPNHHIRNLIEQNCPDGFDGEIMAGKTFNECQSLVMTESGCPKFTYNVFDYVKDALTKPYDKRMQDLMYVHPPVWADKIYPSEVDCIEQLLEEEATELENGYEGLMLRAIDGPYKCGRSTVNEGYLLKLKRFTDSEAEVIGYEEKMHNENAATKDELGHTKRSSHKANLVGAGTLGAILAKDCKSGVEFSIGTGFDDAARADIWQNRESYKGRIFTYTYQASGQKDKPRFPSFKGMRHIDDM